MWNKELLYLTSVFSFIILTLLRALRALAKSSIVTPAVAKPARQFSHAMQIFLCL